MEEMEEAEMLSVDEDVGGILLSLELKKVECDGEGCTMLLLRN